MELKIDFSNKRTIAGVIVLICLIALVFYSPVILSESNPEICIVDGVCQHEQRVELMNQLVPVFILSGIVIGAIVFFFMTTKLEDKKKDLEKVTQALIQFLNKDEKAVIQKILENNGKVFQSEISRIEGIGKLKSHRILQRLSDRGVIEIEKHGKTNIVKLTKNIKEVLVNKE
ncbi:MAG: super-infection exclusion protein B [archaeon]